MFDIDRQPPIVFLQNIKGVKTKFDFLRNHVYLRSPKKMAHSGRRKAGQNPITVSRKISSGEDSLFGQLGSRELLAGIICRFSWRQIGAALV